MVTAVGNGNGGGSGRSFLGVDGGGWTKLLFGFAVAAILASLTWFLWVRDSIAARPTLEVVETSIKASTKKAEESVREAEQSFKDDIDIHTSMPHPRTQQILDGHSGQLQEQREQLIIIGSSVVRMKDDVREIKDDVKKLNRRRRR